MGFFDKKYCDICGAKIGMLGNKKLADGNMCKECKSKLSNWFLDRKESTVEQIKAQLEYREANKANVAAFNATREMGVSDNKTFLVDEDHGWFILLDFGEALDKNPDVFEIAKVKDVRIDVDEKKTEIKYTDENGERRHYSPKHYAFDYKVYLDIDYDSPFFPHLRYELFGMPISGGVDDENYRGEAASAVLDQIHIWDRKLDRKRPQMEMWQRRDDLPGGYRADGMTRMSRFNMERLEEQVDLACEMSEALGVSVTEENAPKIGGNRNEYLVESVSGVMDVLGF